MTPPVSPYSVSSARLTVAGGCGGGPGSTADAGTTPTADAPTADATTADPPTVAPADPTTPAAQSTIVKKTVTETQSIGYSTRTVQDSSLAKGRTTTKTAGRAGVRTQTYEVTLANGKQTAKKLVKSVITRKPVAKVVAVGTKQSGSCDPNYSGACVPIASDVDCAGGSGNGPAYVKGPVRVVGTDIYQLDRDGDRVACDD
jgi:hypothetical protein